MFLKKWGNSGDFRRASALATLAAGCITLSAGAALANEELRPSLNSFDAELGVITAGDLRMWLDGDLIASHNYTASYTNQAGNEVESRKQLNEPLRLVRPTFLIGEPGKDAWIAIKAEMGSDGRSFIDHAPGSARAGAAAAIGYGPTAVYVANGATQDVRTTPAGDLHSVFSTSAWDNTFTKRNARAVNADFLDPTPVWNTMVSQLKDDDFAGGEVFHDTVAIRHDTGYGIFGVMTDFSASAFQLEYRYRGDAFQVNADLGIVSGVQDRWGNEVQDVWARVDAGYLVFDNLMVDGFYMTNFGDVRANSGFGSGSYSVGAGATWEFIENNHLRLALDYGDRNQTNAAADIVDSVKSRRASLAYGLQFNTNYYLTTSLSVRDVENQTGQTSAIFSNNVELGIKF
jgi:hypothetical protein